MNDSKLLLMPTAGLMACILFAPVANAQSSEDEGQIEEIIVTGSNIRREGFDYSSPVEIIGSEVLDQTGTTNLGDLLQTLPQSVASLNNANGAFTIQSSGLNLTSLRNLGTSRTLVLLNGRRFVSGLSPSVGYAVDLNAIPVGMIERIEVLTGGASAVYGSDAVAGVVNIVTKTDFTGLMVEGQVGASMESDKNKEDIYITVGGEFGNGGNAWFSAGWSNDDALYARDRDYSATDLAFFDIDGDGLAESPEWLGSSFPPSGRFGAYKGDGTLWRSGLADQENSDRFNRAEYRTIFVPVERRFAFGAGRYPLADHIEFFGEINYSIVESTSDLEPFALDLNQNVWSIERGGPGGMDVATSPLIPTLLRNNLLADGITNLNQLGVSGTVRRLVEFGPRRTDIARTTIRTVVGFEFDLSDDWQLSTYYTYGKTDQDVEGNGQVNIERAALALDVEVGPDGELQCVDDTARLRGCVPFNVFGEGTISQAAVDYLGLPTNRQGIVEQEVANITLSGNTPWQIGAGPAALAAGLEYRGERGADVPGESVQRGITAGNVSLPTDGSFHSTELFAEVLLPIHERLSLDGAIRAADYSSVGNIATWKFGADVNVMSDLRFRGTISESVRAPNVSDLFAGAGQTFANVQDPCDGVDATTSGNIAENCRSIPVVADRIADQGEFVLGQVERQNTGGFVSGNPLVGEESAESITAGIVWQPGFVENLSLSLDWYQIDIDDGIAITPRSTVLERCFDVSPADFDPTCSGRAVRDPSPGAGALISVDSASANENRFETSGIDLQIRFAMDLAGGELATTVFYNHLEEFKVIGIFDGSVDENAGEILYPKNRAVVNL